MAKTYTHHFDTTLYKGDVTIHTGLFIGGEFVEPVKGDSIEVVNPSNGKVITKVSIGTEVDVDKAVDAAEKAFKTSWGLKVSGAERGLLLNKLANLVEARSDELAALEALNGGKPFQQAKGFDVAAVTQVLRYFAGWADKLVGDTTEGNPDKFTYTIREPYGVCGQIIPWNFPLLMMSWKFAPALATGNTIILKTSEVTPLSAQLFCELVNEAGFPPGVFNVVTGYGNVVGQAMAEHPRIWKLAFTGSTLTGRKIQEAAAKSNLKKVSLELGGKGPNIVFDDANLANAVKSSLMGAYYNMGQFCASTPRVYVQESIYDKFIAAYRAAAQEFTQTSGDPFEPQTAHGPQTSEIHFNRIMSYIESGKQEGATLLLGGERLGNEGFFIQPTIFTGVKSEMKIVQEEIFGPVVTITKFKDEEEVVKVANDTPYGLSAAIFTENVTRAIRVSRAIEAGTIWINQAGPLDAAIPFGGYKQSGSGRELGKEGIEAYTQTKGVHISLTN